MCLGLVIGNRSNSPGVTRDMVGPVLLDPLPVNSFVMVTGVSGSVSGDYSYSTKVEEVPDNSDKTKKNQNDARKYILQKVEVLVAKEEQADLLGALEATAQELRRVKGNYSHGEGAGGDNPELECVIHVYDSGLSTSGAVQFQKNDGALLRKSAGIDSFFDVLPSGEYLRDVTVIFETIGEVVPPQEDLDSDSRERLRVIWERIVEHRGGKVRESDRVPIKSGQSEPMVSPSDSLPIVDVVPISRLEIEVDGVEPMCDDDSTTWLLPGDVLFPPNLADLRDSGKSVLDDAVMMLKEHPEARVEVVGHSASESAFPDWTQVSEDRANSVRDYLISKASDVTITATGVGDRDPICEDWDPIAGVQIEECAIKERRIELVLRGVDLCTTEN